MTNITSVTLEINLQGPKMTKEYKMTLGALDDISDKNDHGGPLDISSQNYLIPPLHIVPDLLPTENMTKSHEIGRRTR